jgi:hypothetical protein
MTPCVSMYSCSLNMQVRDWLKLLLPVFLFKYQIAFSRVSPMEEANFRRLQPSTSPGVYGHGGQQGISQHQQICGIAGGTQHP